MKTYLVGYAALLAGGSLLAQTPADFEALKQQLRATEESFRKAQEEHQRQIEALTRRIEQWELTNRAPATATSLSNRSDAGVSSTKELMEKPWAPPAVAQRGWNPTDPIRLGSRTAYLDLSLDALFAVGTSTEGNIERLQTGAHDPLQRGFSVQNLEMTLAGVIDPYLRGQASIIYQIDPRGESGLEVEEAYLETLTLPGNLQLRAGQYFTEFGRLNPSHPHSWDLVDQPLVNGRFLGPDGLRNPGARLSWLAPTPFFSELFIGVQNSQGETATSFRSDHDGDLFVGRRTEDPGNVKSLGDMLYSARYAASFDLTDEHTVVAGSSAALGPNASGPNRDTQILGLDLFYKWKPANQSKGFPYVTWQTELMYRRYEAGAFREDLDGDGLPDYAVPAETLRDWGLYSQVAYGFTKGWVAALRGDFVNGERGALRNDPDRNRRWRLAPALTWYPSEFSKVRLQYNYDDRQFMGVDHSIWLQWEFLLGAHGAHKF